MLNVTCNLCLSSSGEWRKRSNEVPWLRARAIELHFYNGPPRSRSFGGKIESHAPPCDILKFSDKNLFVKPPRLLRSSWHRGLWLHRQVAKPGVDSLRYRAAF